MCDDVRQLLEPASRNFLVFDANFVVVAVGSDGVAAPVEGSDLVGQGVEAALAEPVMREELKASLQRVIHTRRLDQCRHWANFPVARNDGKVEYVVHRPQSYAALLTGRELPGAGDPPVGGQRLKLGEQSNAREDMMRLDRPGNAGDRARLPTMDLAEIVRQEAIKFDALACRRQVDYKIVVPPSLAARLDATKVRHVLDVLLTRAFDTKLPGDVGIELRREAEQAVLTVSGGPTAGKPAAHSPNALPVSDAAAPDADLEIMVVRAYVAHQGGDLDIGHPPEGGMRFTVRLPVGQVAEGADMPFATARRRSSPNHEMRLPLPADAPLLVVVADDREMRGFLARTLAPFYHVVAADSTREGVEKACKLLPDLVVYDFRADAPWRELFSELLACDDTKEMPILVLAAPEDEAARMALLNLGVHHQVGKPLTGHELLLRVGSLVSSVRQANSARAFLAAIVEGSEDAIVGKDLHGIVTSWNRGAEKVFGYRAAEMLGRTVDPLVPEDRKGEVASVLRRVAAGESIDRFETVRLHKDGHPIDISAVVSPVRDRRGNVVGSSIIARDVTEQRRVIEALRRSEEQFQLIAQTVTEVFWMADVNLRQAYYVSPAYEKVWQRSRDSLYNDPHSFLQAIHPDDRDRVAANLRGAKQTGQPFEQEYRLVLPDGSIRWICDHGFPVVDADGSVSRYIGVAQDITARHETEERLRQTSAVFENTQEGISITDLDGNIVAVNPAFTAITGYSEAEVIGRNQRLLRSGRHDRAFYQNMWQSIQTRGYWQGEIWNRRKSGEIYPELQTISTVRDGAGNPTNYVGMFHDLTRIKAFEERLDHLAHHDALTGLPNRLLFASRLEHALDRAMQKQTRGAVIFVGLDRFKNVNDSLGHNAGDEVIVIAAERLRAQMCATNTLARLGGNEFVVLLEEIDGAASVATFATELIASLAQPFALSAEHIVYLGASAGISVFPDDGSQANQLIRYADTALHHAKTGGVNSFRFYTEAQGERVAQRLQLEGELWRGLSANQFELHFQPLVQLSGARVTGVEALVRWRSPSAGLVSPAHFIGLAEECGLIIPLGDWILETACWQARRWLDAGAPLQTLAVNLSSRQFSQGDLAERVAVILRRTGLPADRLELEITESAVMEGGGESENRLRALKALGVRLAIDDFGTGYSSLAYLKRFPIDKLKIDQTFTRDLPGQPADQAIVATIVAMGKNLNLTVLAEGIETPEQRDFLAGQDCDEGQGYLFSRPVAADEVAALFGKTLPPG